MKYLQQFYCIWQKGITSYRWRAAIVMAPMVAALIIILTVFTITVIGRWLSNV